MPLHLLSLSPEHRAANWNHVSATPPSLNPEQCGEPSWVRGHEVAGSGEVMLSRGSSRSTTSLFDYMLHTGIGTHSLVYEFCFFVVLFLKHISNSQLI